nr:PREDICTED: dual specificity protein phosphatase 12 [Haliaeetus albicilla]
MSNSEHRGSLQVQEMQGRRALFRSSSILSHTEGSGPTAFAHKRITDSARFCGDGREKCTSYFTEPVQWMEPALLGVMEGQLLCPKCTSKLGSFSWQGEQCSCGRWVTPAFQIHKSRVDEVRTLPGCGQQWCLSNDPKFQVVCVKQAAEIVGRAFHIMRYAARRYFKAWPSAIKWYNCNCCVSMHGSY